MNLSLLLCSLSSPSEPHSALLDRWELCAAVLQEQTALLYPCGVHAQGGWSHGIQGNGCLRYLDRVMVPKVNGKLEMGGVMISKVLIRCENLVRCCRHGHSRLWSSVCFMS